MAAETALSFVELFFYFVHFFVSLAALNPVVSFFCFPFVVVFVAFVTVTCACLFLPVQRGLRPLRTRFKCIIIITRVCINV